MKVWECKAINSNKLYWTGGTPPKRVDFHDIIIYENDWDLVSNVEITERKPDYKAMAERGQIGRNGEGILCRLVNYLPAMTTSFEVQYFGEKGAHLTPVFTPCAEPVELDPITMEAKND
jgi:hypothetical protein